MSDNLCIRCGKKRIIARTWKEKIVSYGQVSEIECVERVCPDKKCQALVEKDLAAQKVKTQQINKDREDREAAHKSKMVNLRLGKRKNLTPAS